MTRITDLTEATTLAQTDAVAVDGASGTRKLSMTQAFGRLADTFSQNAYFHRNIYRGKSLGNSYTAVQKTWTIGMALVETVQLLSRRTTSTSFLGFPWGPRS